MPHLDTKDLKKFCMLIPFSDGIGGNICFHEIGLRMSVSPGNVIPFMSGWLTHFNTPFKGRRIGFANYSEASLEAWNDGNGWSGFIDCI
jgi:hypothetical protein